MWWRGQTVGPLALRPADLFLSVPSLFVVMLSGTELATLIDLHKQCLVLEAGESKREKREAIARKRQQQAEAQAALDREERELEEESDG